MYPYCQNWCIAAKKKTNIFFFQNRRSNVLFSKMVDASEKKKKIYCIMHIFHNSRIYISFSACYRWCAYFSGSNELLHHICKLFFFCPRAKHQQDRSLSVYWNVCHYEGKCISKLFDWIAIQPTTCDCQNLSLNLLFSLTFIYNAFAASDIDKKKLSHWSGSTAERESEWEMTEWFKFPIFVHLTNKIYFREIKFTKKRETNITCTHSQTKQIDIDFFVRLHFGSIHLYGLPTRTNVDFSRSDNTLGEREKINRFNSSTYIWNTRTLH